MRQQRDHSFVYIEDIVTGEFIKAKNTAAGRQLRSTEEQKLTETALTAEQEGKQVVEFIIAFFSMSESYLSKVVAGFSICFIVLYFLRPIKSALLDQLCKPPAIFPLVLTAIYELFSWFVVCGRVMCPLIINEAKKRNLQINTPDIYWHYGELKVSSQDIKKKELEMQEKQSKQSISSNSYAYTGGVPGVQGNQSSVSKAPKQSATSSDSEQIQVDWRFTPAYSEFLATSKLFHWLTAFLFAVAYILSTIAGTEAIALNRKEEEIGLASETAWIYLIIVTGGVCIGAMILEIFGEWFVQRRVEIYNKNVT